MKKLPNYCISTLTNLKLMNQWINGPIRTKIVQCTVDFSVSPWPPIQFDSVWSSINSFCVCLYGHLKINHFILKLGLGVWQLARDGHQLPKVSPRPAKPYPSTPCGRTTPKMALQLFQPFRGGPPARPAACSRLLALWTPHAVRFDNE
jgi:hypothetical protein